MAAQTAYRVGDASSISTGPPLPSKCSPLCAPFYSHALPPPLGWHRSHEDWPGPRHTMYLESWPLFNILELLGALFEKPDNSKEYLQAYREGSLAEVARKAWGFPQFHHCYSLELTKAPPKERALLSIEYAGMLKAIEEAGFSMSSNILPFLEDALHNENLAMYYLLLERFPQCSSAVGVSLTDLPLARLAHESRATVGPLLLARFGDEGLCTRDPEFFRRILSMVKALPIAILFHARRALHLALPRELDHLIFRLLARLIQEALPPLQANPRPVDGA